MSGFSVELMRQKLGKLNATPESIQTLSLWLLHHQKHHADEITATWLSTLTKERSSPKIINLMYLANDAIQNCRKRHPEFAIKFFAVLEPALRHCSKIPGPEVAKTVARIVDIFKHRQVFSPDKILRLEQSLSGKKPSSETKVLQEKVIPVVYNLDSVMSACTDVVDSLRNMVDPPSEDAETRHRLVNCPDVVGNPEKLDTIRSEAEVTNLLAQLADIETPAKDYCIRLTTEMAHRRLLQKQIDSLLANVRSAVDYQESALKEIKKREESIRHCTEEIKRVYESLPDLSEMSTDAPLPSAESLFSSR